MIYRGRRSEVVAWGLELLDSIPFFSQEVFVPAWYGHDGHGSVRYLTDGGGKITDTYDYDAFGNLISSTGSSVNNYLFAGEWFDPALGGVLQPRAVLRPETWKVLDRRYVRGPEV